MVQIAGSCVSRPHRRSWVPLRAEAFEGRLKYYNIVRIDYYELSSSRSATRGSTEQQAPQHMLFKLGFGNLAYQWRTSSST